MNIPSFNPKNPANPYSFYSTPAPTNPPWIKKHFNLNPDNILQCDKYYIIYWSARHLYIQLLASPTAIIRERIQYEPVFLGSMDKEYLFLNPEEQIKVSFRRLRGRNKGFVLISRLGIGIDRTERNPE